MADFGVGTVISIDAAVFHRSGVDGACHIEPDIEYVVIDATDDEYVLVLTVEQEGQLRPSIAGILYSLTVPSDNIENHPQVYEYNRERHS